MDETTQNDAATLGRVFFNKLKSAAVTYYDKRSLRFPLCRDHPVGGVPPERRVDGAQTQVNPVKKKLGSTTGVQFRKFLHRRPGTPQARVKGSKDV